VITNALVNNVTNLTLLLGLPAILWRMGVLPPAKAKAKPKKKKPDPPVHELHRLTLLLTLTAGVFFTGAVWALGRDGKIVFGDGLVLIGLFLFWQCFHVFEVLKSNVRQNKSFAWKLLIDLVLLGIGTWAIYISTKWLVDWISGIHSGFVSEKHLGWLSGWLMVLPNGLLAFYYARRGNPEVVYTSQVGDGHISIPLSIGILSLYRTVDLPSFFFTGAKILFLAYAIHFLFIATLGRLPRAMGWVLTAAYLLFLWAGFS
jgi:cation:H+ antiporter